MEGSVILHALQPQHTQNALPAHISDDITVPSKSKKELFDQLNHEQEETVISTDSLALAQKDPTKSRNTIKDDINDRTSSTAAVTAEQALGRN
jgi:hypothetical protein